MRCSACDPTDVIAMPRPPPSSRQPYAPPGADGVDAQQDLLNQQMAQRERERLMRAETEQRRR
jgi:hypothetical protein